MNHLILSMHCLNESSLKPGHTEYKKIIGEVNTWLRELLYGDSEMARCYAANFLTRLGMNPHVCTGIIGTLREALTSFSPDVKQRAIDALGDIRPAAVPALIQILADPEADSYVKSNAAYALGNIGPAAAEAVPALIQILTDPDPNRYVKGCAAEVLGQIGPAAGEAVPALSQP
jgi:vesicle coat complex subunit